jgi:hypothetical protein
MRINKDGSPKIDNKTGKPIIITRSEQNAEMMMRHKGIRAQLKIVANPQPERVKVEKHVPKQEAKKEEPKQEEKKSEINLEELMSGNVLVSKHAISKIEDVSILEAWDELEDRKSVRKALAERIEELK